MGSSSQDLLDVHTEAHGPIAREFPAPKLPQTSASVGGSCERLLTMLFQDGCDPYTAIILLPALAGLGAYVAGLHAFMHPCPSETSRFKPRILDSSTTVHSAEQDSTAQHSTDREQSRERDWLAVGPERQSGAIIHCGR
ncbi:hypothetical protein LZ31DRAFT_55180 [Colletotrichum somersetense]|nr:hypothetical protein LZ31DRAFT_55180 [Colletotrichum somersetense]